MFFFKANKSFSVLGQKIKLSRELGRQTVYVSQFDFNGWFLMRPRYDVVGDTTLHCAGRTMWQQSTLLSNYSLIYFI